MIDVLFLFFEFSACQNASWYKGFLVDDKKMTKGHFPKNHVISLEELNKPKQVTKALFDYKGIRPNNK